MPQEMLTFKQKLISYISVPLFPFLLKTKLMSAIADSRYFAFWEKNGFHVTHVDFEDAAPDTSKIPKTFWIRQTSLIGIDMNEQVQLRLLEDFTSRFKKEYATFPKNPTSVQHQFFIENGLFSYVDAEILYCMIRNFKPKRIIEIGSGKSTLLSAQAILKNKQEDPEYNCELIAIEPFPNNVLIQGFPGLSKLIQKKVQDVSPSLFTQLEENDILFIDSSHVLNTASDVQYEYLEILPNLKKGVIIHCHDIFLPYEYPKEWITKYLRFFNEQYILQAFLSFNNSFETLWASYYMHKKHYDILKNAFSPYEGVLPASFWIKRTR